MAERPRNLDPLAEKILEQLVGRPEAAEIVLGGYFALQHYAHYRTTHDIDAWWRRAPSIATQQVIREAMQHIASAKGYELQERRFGDTVSFELRRERRKRFSFQIAVRSVELDEPVPSAWPPVLIETLHDNIGAKMNALVDRGAPRDFLDIMHLATTKLMTPAECWTLWSRKNPGASVESARNKVQFHLTAMESRRPLDSLKDPEERAKARRTRDWFRHQFLGRGG